jgi:flagellar biosynthesis/type III secretory pathway protein FliH
MPIQVQEASRTPNRLKQNRTTPQHIIIKTTGTETRKRILKAAREKKQITYKVNPLKSQQISQQKPKKQEEHGVRSSGH